jgi:hypothetical protein
MAHERDPRLGLPGAGRRSEQGRLHRPGDGNDQLQGRCPSAGPDRRHAGDRRPGRRRDTRDRGGDERGIRRAHERRELHHREPWVDRGAGHPLTRQRQALRGPRERRGPRGRAIRRRLAGPDRDHQHRAPAGRWRGHHRGCGDRPGDVSRRGRREEGGRDPGCRSRVHPQPGRQLVLRQRSHERRIQRPRDRRRSGRQLRPSGDPGGWRAGVRGPRRGRALVPGADDGGRTGARRGGVRLPGRAGLRGGVERLVGPVPAGFPRRRQRPPVPDRSVDRRHRRRPRTGGPGGDGQHGPCGLQRRRRPGIGGLAEADHGLDGRQSARRQLGNARHSTRRPQGRRQSDPVGLHQRLRHVGSGMLARVVAALPPRQRELRGLRARRCDARHPVRRARHADEHRLRRPRGRPAVRHRGELPGGHVERPNHPRQLRRR